MCSKRVEIFSQNVLANDKCYHRGSSSGVMIPNRGLAIRLFGHTWSRPVAMDLLVPADVPKVHASRHPNCRVSLSEKELWSGCGQNRQKSVQKLKRSRGPWCPWWSEASPPRTECRSDWTSQKSENPSRISSFRNGPHVLRKGQRLLMNLAAWAHQVHRSVAFSPDYNS
jgi:hypothetical protein